MKKYYLHNGTESSGPFDTEELKVKKITKANKTTGKKSLELFRASPFSR